MALTPRRASRGGQVALGGIPPLPTERDLTAKMYRLNSDEVASSTEKEGTLTMDEKASAVQLGEVTPNTVVSIGYSGSEDSDNHRTIAIGHNTRG